MRKMVKHIWARYEKNVLVPLEKLDLNEGEKVKIIIIRKKSDKTFGALLKRRPNLTLEDVEKIIEEIENEGVL